MTQGKHWRSTVFDLDKGPSTWPDVSYAVWQLETCPTSFRDHFQCYVRFNVPKRRQWLLKNCYEGDWRPANNPDGARRYCMKIDSRKDPEARPQEIGEWKVTPTKGKRTDWLALKKLIDDPKVRTSAIRSQHYSLWMTHQKAIQGDLVFARQGYSRPRPEILLIIGESGVGKSRYARKAFPNAFWLQNEEGKVWFDGYAQQDTIVIDEFEGWIRYTDLKRLLDRGPCSAPIKGSKTPIVAHRWIITSNRHPITWYPKVKDPTKSLDRRLTEFSELLFIGKDKQWVWLGSYLGHGNLGMSVYPEHVKEFIARDIKTHL